MTGWASQWWQRAAAFFGGKCPSRGPWTLLPCVHERGHGGQHRNERGWTWG